MRLNISLYLWYLDLSPKFFLEVLFIKTEIKQEFFLSFETADEITGKETIKPPTKNNENKTSI